MVTLSNKPWEILGVSENASEKEIKKAYRQLARKYHPDANSAVDASERFKEIQLAYQILTDPAKRVEYDRNNGVFSEVDFTEAFRDIFGERSNPFGGIFGEAEHNFGFNPVLTVDLPITPSESVNGADKSFSIDMQVKCPICPRPGNWSCRECGGTGKVFQLQTLNVRIPAMTPHGANLKATGASAPVHISINVALPSGFDFLNRQGDLMSKIEVPLKTALFGGQMTVHGPLKNLLITIPAKTNSGGKIRLQGQGLPNFSGSRGSLYLQVEIKLPNLSKEQEEIIKKNLPE